MSVNKQLREMALPIFFSIAQFWYGLPTSFQFYDPAACTAVLTVAPFHFFKHISGTVQFAAVLERTWDESIFKLSKVKDIVVEDQQKYSARTVRKDITIVRDLQDKTASYKHFAIKVTACLTYEVFWTHANSTVTSDIKFVIGSNGSMQLYEVQEMPARVWARVKHDIETIPATVLPAVQMVGGTRYVRYLAQLLRWSD